MKTSTYGGREPWLDISGTNEIPNYRNRLQAKKWPNQNSQMAYAIPKVITNFL